MNKFGVLSVVMAAISVAAFFTMRGPTGDIYLTIFILSVLSILGLLFATVSKRMLWMIFGIGLNLPVLIFAFFLLLAMGIGEP